MAIVFVSPRKKQKVAFWIITTLSVLFFAAIYLVVFPPQFTSKYQDLVIKNGFTVPDIKINFNIVDSDQVKSLEPFDNVETEFNYTAKDKDGKNVAGKVLAIDKDNAKSILEKRGFEVIILEEENLGRNEPFVPYYQSIKPLKK